SRRRHRIFKCDWSSDVCSSDLLIAALLVCKKLLEVRNESRLSFLTMTHIEEAFNRALQSGDEQIGYPWTEKDCGDDERLILSVMASEDKGLGPLPITRIQQRLNETGLAADISIAVKRL